MTPAIVVGAGPVGMTAALLLARSGVRTLLLEAETHRSAAGSRSICVQRDVLNVLERVGLGKAVVAAGVTWYRGRTYHRDDEVLTIDLPREEGAFPPFVNTPQSVVERLLEERVRAEPLIELRFGQRVCELDQTDDRVRLSTEDGSVHVGAHCVAADGARSAVRRLLGVSFDGYSFDDRFVIADVRVDLDFPEPERRFYFDPPCSPGRQVLLHPQPGGVYRIDWQVPEGFELTDAHLRAVVGDRPYEVRWQSTYRFHQRRASSLRVGRVLLAGDAAHVMSPFGARGLNSGICDADNAAWKVAFDLAGKAGPGLLPSYDLERGAAADENLRVTGQTMRFLVPRTEEERERRRTALRDREGIDSGKLFEPFAYTDSPLTAPGCTGHMLPDSAWCGPDFARLPDGSLVRPDGHLAGPPGTTSRRATGYSSSP